MILAVVLFAAPAQSGDAEIAYDRGMAAISSGNGVLAMEAFTEALEANPKHGPSALERGKLLLKIGEPKLAVADFTVAVLANPTSGIAYAWRGDAMAVLKSAQAIQDYDTAVDLEPRNEDVYVMRAAYLLKTGEIDKARLDLQRAMSLTSSAEKAHQIGEWLKKF